LLKYLYFPSISIEWCCITLISICLVVTVIKRLIQKGVLSKRQGYASAVLVGYIIFLLVITVFARTVRAEREYELRVFWTYRDIAKDGVSFLVWQILYNLLMFLPVGILTPCIKKTDDNSYRDFFIALGLGGVLSIVIETLQFIFKRGVFEIDDVIHNIISVFLGYTMYRVYIQIRNSIRTFTN
jgi:glycopeptide antibiotics resistance protein